MWLDVRRLSCTVRKTPSQLEMVNCQLAVQSVSQLFHGPALRSTLQKSVRFIKLFMYRDLTSDFIFNVPRVNTRAMRSRQEPEARSRRRGKRVRVPESVKPSPKVKFCSAPYMYE